MAENPSFHFGPPELEKYRIDVSPDSPRGRHPHDSQAQRVFETVLEKSSADQHMAIQQMFWKNQDGTPSGRSTQWGSQFDTPQHFYKEGASDVDRTLVSGPARVVDLRPELEGESDGLAITSKVVQAWFERTMGGLQIGESQNKTWKRILLQTLKSEQAMATSPMSQFPYFADPEVVNFFINKIWTTTGVGVKVVYHEPPSVDEVNQGHLLHPNNIQQGGAHGAFYKNGVIIGENWDLQRFTEGQTGIVRVFFDSTMNGAKDAVAVSGAYFFPEENLEEVRKIFVPSLS